MSKNDFDLSEFNDRRQRVRDAMRQKELDWLILIHPVSIHWLTGSDAKSYQEFQCLFFSSGNEPMTVLTREGEVNEFRDDALVDRIIGWGGGIIEDPIQIFAKTYRDLGLTGSRIGVEVPAYYLHPFHYTAIKDMLGSSFVEATNFIHDLKLVKSQKEQSYIRKAVTIADHAMGVFAEHLKEGETELALAGEVYRALLTSGSGIAASTLNLVSGERSSFSHGAPTERKLKNGDYGSIEYGSTFRRYTATIGRQFCLGTPTARMVELYDIVRKAGDACMAAIKPGVPATVPHAAAAKIIHDAGLSAGRVHTTGYGLAPGFPPTWGEPIHMLDHSPYTITEGMVLTVEPPVFLGEEFLGARLIDNVLVTSTGVELLTRYSRDLIVIN